MKKLIFALVIAIALFSLASCDNLWENMLQNEGAVPATPGVIYDLSDDKSYAMVVGYNGTATNVKIAGEYEGLPVKYVFRDAFAENQTIQSVVIPDSVTKICERAFLNCHSLTSVEIGDSVTNIGNSAFAGCIALPSVVIPDSVTKIGNSAFYGCSSLTSVVIPDSVTSIGGSAFSECRSLEFNEYDNCRYLGNESNPYLALIEVSNKDMSGYDIHNDTRIIADNAFRGCKVAASIVIPDSVTSIGEYAFCDCYSLTSVVIPDSVTSIGSSAFWFCVSLTSVVIGNSVTSIDVCAFYYCGSLTDVYYTGTEEEWAKISIGSSNSYLTSAEIHYNYAPEE